MLTEEVSNALLDRLKPIRIFSGDNHDSCQIAHNRGIEVSPPFSLSFFFLFVWGLNLKVRTHYQHSTGVEEWFSLDLDLLLCNMTLTIPLSLKCLWRNAFFPHSSSFISSTWGSSSSLSFSFFQRKGISCITNSTTSTKNEMKKNLLLSIFQLPKTQKIAKIASSKFIVVILSFFLSQHFPSICFFL